MPRPRKKRTVEYIPAEMTYKPVGRRLADLPQVWLSYDELEALRLADLEGLYQAEGAARMGISRSTFQRTLSDARRKVARALVEGTALVIGRAETPVQRWRCGVCDHAWAVLHGSGEAATPACPRCGHAVDEV
ncbi:MAG TPA: DUF134 domain-containing protein [Anaerolineales bacterium]|nr:DUF134 domain-containing protein [Anaerolineales bacterium]